MCKIVSDKMSENKKEKIVRCPECKKVIDNLVNVESGSNSYIMTVDLNKYASYKEEEFDPDSSVNVWDCPECSAELFNNEEDALKFLLGAKVKKDGYFYKAIE